MSEWISVTEKFPEDCTNVLVYGQHWKYRIAQLDFYAGNAKAWYQLDGGFIGHVNSSNITHWQPLPEPPK